MKNVYYVVFVTNLLVSGNMLHSMEDADDLLQQTHYMTLGVSSDSTTEEIKTAYKRLAAQYHPDKNYGNEKAVEPKFKSIVAAYDTLKDCDKKFEYDNSLHVNSSVHKSFIWDWLLPCKIGLIFFVFMYHAHD